MIFETDRLLLREFNTGDADFIIELLNSPGWLQFIGDRKVHTIEDAKNYLINGPMKSYQINGFGLSLVELKKNKTPIGMCGLINRDTLDDIDIGFALLPDFAGKGYAYEIATGTLNYASNVLGIKKIVAITLESNNNSVRLLKKIGLHFERMIDMDGESLMLFSTGMKV